ncbi:MAG: zinc metallopeptidase [Lentisphaeraceae bacterium]|nr:zinc metallopeptidase [Lentisphaeraceae bacterium]
MFAMFDPMYWVFIIPGLLLSLMASWMTKSTFAKYSKIRGSKGLTGAQAAKTMLERNGVYDCTIEPVAGMLTDHYDPRSKTLRLSSEVYSSTSLSAIGVACHEAGHALQHANNYAFLTMRSSLVSLVGICSNLGYFVIIASLFFLHSKTGVLIGCVLFATSTLFSIVTLPVEWDASARAKKAMVTAGLLSPQETSHAGRVLNAAFLTYLASAISSIMVLLYYLWRAGLIGGGRR